MLRQSQFKLMRKAAIVFVSLLGLTAIAACTRDPEPVGKIPTVAETGTDDGEDAGSSGEETASAKVPEVVEPPKPQMPEVALTEAHAATCLVKVGDKLPLAALPDLAGEAKPLEEHFGEKLTVVLFWTATDRYSAFALSDMAGKVQKPYADRGVRVVAVNVADPVEDARQEADKLGGAIVMLGDPERKLFGQVATEGALRPYLLDAEGKILWFDIGYSRSTRATLLAAIDFVLSENP